LRATRLFGRKAGPTDLYFDRVPSLPATDDGSAKPLAEDLSSGSGDSEDISWDADTEPSTADTAGGPGAAGADGGQSPAGAEPRAADAEAGAEPEFTEADVALLSGLPEADTGPADSVMPGPEDGEMAHGDGDGDGASTAHGDEDGDGASTAHGDEDGDGASTAHGDGDGDGASAAQDASTAQDVRIGLDGSLASGEKAAPKVAKAPEVGESGRWFRPARAKVRYQTMPAEVEADIAEPEVAAADEQPDGDALAEPGRAAPEGPLYVVAADAPPQAEPQEGTGPADEGSADGGAGSAAGRDRSAAGPDGSAAGRTSALAPPGGPGSAGDRPAAWAAEPADVAAGERPWMGGAPGVETEELPWTGGAGDGTDERDGGQESGQQEDGRQESGQQEDGRQESGQQEDGRQESGQQEGGGQESGQQEGGGQESGQQEDGRQEGGEQHGEEQEGGLRRRVSRRTLLQAGLIGGAGVAALPLLALVGGGTHTDGQAAGLTFSVNTNWLFGGYYTAGSETNLYDDGSFAPVAVPHTVTPLSWQNWDFPAWQQVWIYRRHFTGSPLLDRARPGNRILLDFDGVMVNATVVINNQVVATHQGGYLPFSAELTGKVAGGDNLLAVVVDARCLPVPPVGVGGGPSSVDFFQPGGIYRDVRLRVLPPVFLADLSARPADVLGSRPRVDIECAVDSAATGAAEGTLLVQLLDGPQPIATQSAPVKVDGRGKSTARLSLSGFGPVRLWSPDSPELYTVQATLTFPGLGRHVLSRRIGFREASFRPEGFFLNGERLQLFGLNRHQLYPYAGMAMGSRVQRKDAEILKNDFNCNMVRCSHYPQSPAFLDACDELGLLVWEEAPGWHNVSTTPAWQDAVVRDVRDMVIRDRSRPSVIIWGTRLNEARDVPGLWAATRQAARELDPTRPSSGAMAYHGTADWDEDVYAHNDYRTDKAGNVTLRPPFPGLPYLVTEAVGVEAAKPAHFAWTDPPAWLARQAAMHGQAQSQARSNAGYAGLLGWVGFDYSSMLGPGPYDIKWAGVADGFRVPKPGAAIYQSQADPAVRPVIIPVFFWEAGGPVPSPGPASAATAMIASNCDRLEVFIGGTHVASARPAAGSPMYGGLAHPPFLVRFPRHLPNPAPDLLIQGFVGERPLARRQMSARPGGDALAMTVDDTVISADGSDATRAVFRAIDTYGNQRRYRSGEVALNLSGPATLVGDNPFAFGRYGGLGAVWIRSLAGQPGAITLTASHPLLGQAEIQLRSERVNHLNELA
jgi:beta-galactosidase